jgi:hypothetical protein
VLWLFVTYPRIFGYFNKDKYPVLSLIAQKYLEIPVSLVSFERFFSQGANIISKNRNKVNFEKILYLRSWGFIKKEEENK